MINILVVEDNASVRSNIVAILGEYTAHALQIVGTAANGVEALEILRHTPVDLLITDVFMPLKDGLALLREARAFLPNLHCIFISAYDDYQYMRTAIKLNAAEYLLKPLRKSDLFESVSQLAAQIELGQLQTQSRQHDEYLHACMSKLYAALFSNTPIENGQTWHMVLAGIRHQHPIALWQQDSCYTMPDGSFCFFLRDPQLPVDYAVMLSLVRNPAAQMVALLQQVLEQEQQLQGSAYCTYLEAYETLHAARAMLEQVNSALRQRFFAKRTLCLWRADKTAAVDKRSRTEFLEAPQALKFQLRILYGSANQRSLFIDQLFDTLRLYCERQYERLWSAHRQLQSFYLALLSTTGTGNIDILRSFANQKLDNYLDMHQLRQAFCDSVAALPCVPATEQEKVTALLVKEYIDTNFSTDIRLTELAQMVYLHPDSLRKIFKKYVGQTFIDYLISVRLLHADTLLRETSLSITQISMDVGYNSVANFIKAYKQRYQITPTARRSQR